MSLISALPWRWHWWAMDWHWWASCPPHLQMFNLSTPIWMDKSRVISDLDAVKDHLGSITPGQRHHACSVGSSSSAAPSPGSRGWTGLSHPPVLRNKTLLWHRCAHPWTHMAQARARGTQHSHSRGAWVPRSTSPVCFGWHHSHLGSGEIYPPPPVSPSICQCCLVFLVYK